METNKTKFYQYISQDFIKLVACLALDIRANINIPICMEINYRQLFVEDPLYCIEVTNWSLLVKYLHLQYKTLPKNFKNIHT